MAEIFHDIRYDFVSADWTQNILRDIEVVTDENEFVQIILIRLLTPRGQYILNPEIGSDLYLLSREKVTSVTKNQIEKIIRDALSPEIIAGNITELEVTTSTGDSSDSIKIGIVATLFNGNPVNINLLMNI